MKRILVLPCLILAIPVFAMEAPEDHLSQLSSQKAQLVALVKEGNQTLQAISTSGIISNPEKLNQISQDISTGTNALETLIIKIKATIASNEKDPEAERIMEDIGGCILDVVEVGLPLIPTILEQVAEAKEQNHPVTKYHQTLKTLKAKAPASN